MASLQDASARVSAFLSDSRLLAEQAKKCKNTNCAFLCTGLTPSHCCRLCARTPGEHGPKCQRSVLPCSSPGCTYAVTGLAPAHCCRVCATGRGEHGPNCWHLPAEATVCTEDEVGASEEMSGPAGELGGEQQEEDFADETDEERALRLELDAKIMGNEEVIQANDDLIRELQAQVQGG